MWKLEADGHSIIQGHGDADRDIVSEAPRLATQGNSMKVVADDTDILVLLLQHFSNDMADIYLLSESKQLLRKLKKLISIRELAEKASRTVLQNLLLIHAWRDWDSTSAVYGAREVRCHQDNSKIRIGSVLLQNVTRRYLAKLLQ